MKPLARYQICVLPLLVLLVLLCSLPQPSSAETEVSAAISPETFALDEGALLQVSVKNARDIDIILPETDGLRFHSRGQSTQVQMINSSVTSSVVHSYLVEALQEGTHEIPPIRVIHGKETMQTKPLSCAVTAPSGSRGRQAPDGSGQALDAALASVTFSPQKETIFVGEVVPARLKVYLRGDKRINPTSLPQLQGEGLLLDELSNKPVVREERVDDIIYTVLVWDTFVTGIKEGLHESTFALDATVLVKTRQSRRPGLGSGFFNDNLFDEMFSSYVSKPVQIASEPITMEVRSLPETAKPDNFTGAVGRFTLQLDAQPTEIDPGEPVTLTMTVSGSGNFNQVTAPAISREAGIKAYTPTQTFSADTSPYRGVKQFQQAVIFTDPAVTALPPVTFSYFDPEEKRYRTLFSDPVPVTIKPSTSAYAAVAPQLTGEAVENLPDPAAPAISLVPVKLTPGTPVERIRPPFLAPWFISAASLCVFMIVGLFGFRLYSDIRADNAETLYLKKLAAAKKEALALLDRLDPGRPNYAAEARTIAGKLLSIRRRTDSVSLTTADIIEIYGAESAIAELFRISDQVSYGKRDRSADSYRTLHQQIKSWIAALS